MMKTTTAALVALLISGATMPGYGQTMQKTTQTAQDQTTPVAPEQTTPGAPDQTAPAVSPDQTQETAKPAHVKKAHHLRHRHTTKAVARAKANAGDTTKADSATANPVGNTDDTAPK